MEDSVEKAQEILSKVLDEEINSFVIAIDTNDGTRCIAKGRLSDISHLLAVATAHHTKAIQED